MAVNNILVPDNGIAKKPTSIYAPQNGVAKKVVKVYAPSNGVAKLVYELGTPTPVHDYIEVTVDNPGIATTAQVGNLWRDPITVTNMTTGQQYTVSNEAYFSTNIPISQGDVLRYEPTISEGFRYWQASALTHAPLIRLYNSQGSKVPTATASLTYIPPMNRFTTTAAGTTAGHSFFRSFNYEGSLASLPEGSFDTSGITTGTWYSFSSFNQGGALTSLPIGSFNTSALATPGNEFFSAFNAAGKLTSLPEGSFDTSNIATYGLRAFRRFNGSGALTSLPAGSFNMSKVTKVDMEFCFGFNDGGALTSLPIGSFDTSNITSAKTDFLTNFNHNGSLTRGNNQVAIYAAGAITGFGVGDQTDIAQGAIGYVNGA